MMLPSRICCARPSEADELGAIWVGTASNWSNHYKEGDTTPEMSVALYRDWFNSDDRRAAQCREALHTLRGRTLASDDPLGVACHVDVLLELANVGLPGAPLERPLMLYHEAVRAIAAATQVDEVKLIMDQAAALQAAAHIARNKAPEVQFAEIRLRAERRLGEMLIAQKNTVGLATGAAGIGKPEAEAPEQYRQQPPTLKAVGIEKKLSARAQKIAAVPAEKFEGMLAEWRGRVGQENERVTTNLLKEGERQQQREARAETRIGYGRVEDLHALAASGYKAGAIMADPALRFKTYSARGEDRSAIQHYNVQTLEQLKALPIADLAAADCALFLWVLDWGLEIAWELLKAWGFEHKTTAFTWVKLTSGHDYTPRFDGKISDRDFHMGQGLSCTRANPEDCWFATRGSPTRLDAGVRQLVLHPVMEHSRKPDVHPLIERMFAGPYLELNARRERDGWTTHGDEIPWRGAVEQQASTPPAAPALPPPSPECPNPGWDQPFEAEPGLPYEEWRARMRELGNTDLTIPAFLKRGEDKKQPDGGDDQHGGGEQ